MPDSAKKTIKETAKDEVAESLPTTSSGEKSPAQTKLNIPNIHVSGSSLPADGTRNSSSRTSSPSRLPTELALKVKTQMERYVQMQETLDALPNDATGLTLPEIEERRFEMEELHKQFLEQHAYFEKKWPETQLDHAYFADSVHRDACRCYSTFRLNSAKLLGHLIPAAQPRDDSHPVDGRNQPRLPPIKLPKFTGDYSKWPNFSELFTSIIDQHKELTDVERFHYLHGCLEGAPAQLISGLPHTGTSFEPAWNLLSARYQNERLNIQSHLDVMFNVKPLTSKSAAGLNTLITTITEAYAALNSLGVNEKLGEYILVHHISKSLDRSSREAWETSLGPSQEYPTFAELQTFLDSRARALERVEFGNTQQDSSSKGATRKTSHQASAQRPKSAQHGSSSSHKQPYPCDLCSGAHFVVTCEKFRALGAAERRKLVVDKRLCYNCLGRHSARDCRSTLSCKECKAKHHTMLHDASKDNSSKPTEVGAISHTSAHNSSSRSTLLATAIAHVNSSVATHQVRLLVDLGSELTFVTEELIGQLNISRQSSSFAVLGIGGSKSTQTRGVGQLTLKAVNSTRSVTVQAHVLRMVTSTLPSFEAQMQAWPHLEKLSLADPDFLIPRPIDIIIGADYYGQIIKPNIIRGSVKMPIAQLSIFGWLVLGPVHVATATKYTSHKVTAQHEDASLQELLTKFWVQEELPNDTAHKLTPEEEECEAHFVATHSRDSSGRYIVRIPLKSSATHLGDSYGTAHRCLQQTLRRLTRDNNYRNLYRQFLQEYEDLGHMKKASSTPTGNAQYYLPHHGVLRPESATTKLRVVFNGSSATTTGYSLNDLMHTGAKLQLDIPDVLIWIRLHRHVFATDITKMFRQIGVQQEDWDLQKILWVDGQLKPVPYHLTTVTYGTKSAPFLSVRTLLQLVHDEGSRFPLAIPPLQYGRYVDDIFGGADSEEQLIEVAQQLRNLCEAGGFPLAKWHSTSQGLLKVVSSASTSKSEFSMDDCTTKILGLNWLPRGDTFVFTSQLSAHRGELTKRHILSEVAQIFDPLGFISPVTVRAKMLLQELWLHKLGWDDTLPSQVSSRWLQLREDLTNLARLSLPRWINTWSSSTVEIHGFSDASQLAMSAVVYIVVSSPSTGAQASLLCSKTKVAPLKTLTILRLELTAALLLARLITYVQKTLRMEITATHLWTDSRVTLVWILSHASRWKDFVRNRVTEIQEIAPDAQWRHVPGTRNPADCASRGISTAQLKGHALWWTGPPWITQPMDSWPAQPTTPVDTSLSAQDIRPGISLISTVPNEDYHWDLIYKVSTLKKLYRLTAICFRVALRLKRELEPPIYIIPSEDVEKARIFWIKATQAAYFSSELKTMSSGATLSAHHPFSRLTAFVDGQGVIRVGGRLTQSALTLEGKHPAILPRQARLSLMLIDDAHQRTLHGGTQLTLAHIRQSYWILGGRAPVKSHILRCVDYAGPLTLKTWKGRGSKTQKGWICVFVCFSTSAVHLEAVSDSSTEGFIATYRRLTARRGISHTLYSDCGTNFVGADAALRRLFDQSSQEHQDISSVLSRDNSQWTFNPPAAPHMGGKWEAVVKSTKFHLRRTIGESLFTFEELTTLLSQIEAILNSRPLEPLTDDPQDVSALTPGHFLIGTALTTLPEPSLQHLATSRLSHWQLIQQRVQSFWSQWSAHYLQRQQSISKWHHPSNIIKVGSLVLITDERFPPCKWPLARVLELHPGKDGLARVATLKTATTTLTRPLIKLSPLPTPQPDHHDTAHHQHNADGGENVGESKRG